MDGSRQNCDQDYAGNQKNYNIPSGYQPFTLGNHVPPGQGLGNIFDQFRLTPFPSQAEQDAKVLSDFCAAFLRAGNGEFVVEALREITHRATLLGDLPAGDSAGRLQNTHMIQHQTRGLQALQKREADAVNATAAAEEAELQRAIQIVRAAQAKRAHAKKAQETDQAEAPTAEVPVEQKPKIKIEEGQW